MCYVSAVLCGLLSHVHFFIFYPWATLPYKAVQSDLGGACLSRLFLLFFSLVSSAIMCVPCFRGTEAMRIKST